MILVITHKIDLSADLGIKELSRQGHDVVRVNVEDYPLDITLSYYPDTQEPPLLKIYGRPIALSELRTAWYRVPYEFSVRRWAEDYHLTKFIESASNHVWYPFELFTEHCVWMNSPLAVLKASYKLFQLKVAKELGMTVPRTCVTNDPDAARNFYVDVGKHAIVKTISGGVIYESDIAYGVFTNPVKDKDLQYIDSISKCPCQLQEYVEKNIELRIVVVEENCFAVEIHSQASRKAKHDWRHYDFSHVSHEVHELPTPVKNQCVGLVRELGLLFGAIDMILTPDGRYVFLEVNPTGQYGWLEDLTGLPITDCLVDALASWDSQ